MGVSVRAHAQGGPPFITDDPETPGNGRWEINLGWTGQQNAADGEFETPNVDMNYGWGDRIQLKYEIPLTIANDEHNTTLAGLGNSLLGVKWRPYELHRRGEAPTEENQIFSLGLYPQVSISNPSSSVRRGVVEPGPQYYLPIEFSLKLGSWAFNGEAGRWIGNRHVPDRWGKGLIAGREFSKRFEMYGEIYDSTQIDHEPGEARQRSVTLDLGARRTLDHAGRVRLLLMGGRSIHAAHADNGEPNWIAYTGVQLLLGRREKEEAKP